MFGSIIADFSENYKYDKNALRFLSERFLAKAKPPRKILEGF